jgi:hypothetical protein
VGGVGAIIAGYSGIAKDGRTFASMKMLGSEGHADQGSLEDEELDEGFEGRRIGLGRNTPISSP